MQLELGKNVLWWQFRRLVTMWLIKMNINMDCEFTFTWKFQNWILCARIYFIKQSDVIWYCSYAFCKYLFYNVLQICQSCFNAEKTIMGNFLKLKIFASTVQLLATGSLRLRFLTRISNVRNQQLTIETKFGSNRFSVFKTLY